MRPSRPVTWLAVSTLLMAITSGSSTAQEQTPFGATVEVKRILTEVRVVDYDGNPIPGLGPDDFRVKIDRTRVEVESVTWIPSTTEMALAAEPPREDSSSRTDSPRALAGRLIVVVFQVDFAFHRSRVTGLVRMAPYAAEFVRGLGPDDRVAVFVYDSHLQLRTDFSSDLDAVAAMLSAPEILEGRMDGPPAGDLSLAEHLDLEAAKDAGIFTRAVEVIANSLEPIPGPKSLVLFGYGMGRMTAGDRITIGDAYENALEALSAARISVFSIDTTDAGYHSLEKGLRTVSRDTGGIYVKTSLFPENAMERLVRVISSYYELSIIPPPDLGDTFKIKVKVDRPGTDVYVRQ